MIKRIIIAIKKALGLYKPEPEKKQSRSKSRKSNRVNLNGMSEMELIAYHYEQAQKHYSKHGETIDENTSDGLQVKLQKKRKLKFEFIPKKQARKNCRSFLEYKTGSFDSWKKIRDAVDSENDSVCEICGTDSKDIGFSHSTECHEVWKYDEVNKVQTLTDLEALCVVCHKTKHANQWKDDEENLISWYAVINDIDIEQATNDFEVNMREMERLKNKYFTLDMSYLNKYGIKVEKFDCHAKEFTTFLYSKEEKENEE